jgi:hypothetical protein
MKLPKKSGGSRMEYKEIANLVVRELIERSLGQQRQEDQHYNSLLKRHIDLLKKMEQCGSSLDEASKQLFSDYHQIINEIDAYQERYLYVQGARDCVMLLKSLGVL